MGLYLQADSPGKAKEANWLPAAKAKFIPMLRLYWPKDTPPSIIAIACNVCPAFQRRHTSIFCSAESPNRFPGFINTTFESSFIPDGVAATV